MANTSTVLFLILLGITFMFSAFPVLYTSSESGAELNKTYGELDQSINSFQNSVQSFSVSNSIGVLLGNGVAIASGAFDVFKNMFKVIPTSAINALQIPVVGPFIGLSIAFLIAMGAISYFLGRGGNM